MGWIKQIPVWVWLLLAAWELPKVLLLFRPYTFSGRLLFPTVRFIVLLMLAACRLWLWRVGDHPTSKPKPSNDPLA